MRSAPADPAGLRRRGAALLLAGLAPVALLSACSGDEYVAPTVEPSSDTTESAVATSTVDALERAARRGATADAEALGASESSAALLAAVADNAAALDLAPLSLQYLTETGEVDGDAWSATVEVAWGLRGFEGSALTEVEVGFADGGETITSIGPATGAMPLWLTGALDVRRSGRVVVMAAGLQDRVDVLADQARSAIAAVDAALGPRGGGLVIEVPRSAEELDRTIGAEPGSYGAIAALTASADGTQVAASPIHVFVNPDVYGGLGPVAAQIVMTHEATHAATRAPLAGEAELWLVEGFADWVALRDTRLPVSRAAAQIIAAVRRGTVPGSLPTRVDFDTDSTHVGAVYESAWLVCTVLAERGGDDALVGLYDAVLDGADLAAELRRRFDWSVADLTEAWQQELSRLAAADGGNS